MNNAHGHYSKTGVAACLIALLVCISFVAAVSDGIMPKMPGPPTTPIYWQLVQIDQQPAITPASGYDVQYDAAGLSIDLADGLMAESLLETDEPSYQPEVILSVSKGEQLIEHNYTWTAPPIYLEKDGVYPIHVKSGANLTHERINSRLTAYILDEQQGRVSAGGYNNYPDSLSFNITTDTLLQDGRIIVSFIVRDEHEMFRLRVDYTYEMHDGAKPKPTPFPGFLPVDLIKDGAPAYYDEVPGVDGLWRVTTAPDEYRAFGSMNGGEARFYPADANGNVVMNAPPADLADDFMSYVQGFVATTPGALPSHYREMESGVFGFTSRDGKVITRAHGRVDGAPDAFYPRVGDPAVVSTIEGAVDPEQDYIDYIEGFGMATPSEAVSHYQQTGNVYAFTGRDGITQYRVFGRLNGAEPAYYPSTEGGELISETPVDPQDDFDAFIKGFDAAAPEAIPSHYQHAGNGVYFFTDRDGTPFYRVFGVLDGAAPAFYPSDADGNRLSEAQAVSPTEDFESFIAGFDSVTPLETPQFYEETDVPGVWAFEDIDGNTQYRTYGSLNRTAPAFYPSDAQGAVDVAALPINPASDLLILPPPPVFTASTPENPPIFYAPVEGQEGLYSFIDQDGNTVYRVYGGYDDAPPAFYPADASGALPEDAAPAIVEEDQEILAKPSATPITFVIVTQSPTEPPALLINRSIAPPPMATPYAYTITEAPEASKSLRPLLRTVAATPSPTAYAHTVKPLLPSATLNPTISRIYESTPSPTPYAFEIVQEPSPSPTSAPVTIRVYTAAPNPTLYVSTVAPTSASTQAPDAVRQTTSQTTPVATSVTSVVVSAEPDTASASPVVDRVLTTDDSRAAILASASVPADVSIVSPTAQSTVTADPTAEAPTDAPTESPTESPTDTPTEATGTPESTADAQTEAPPAAESPEATLKATLTEPPVQTEPPAETEAQTSNTAWYIAAGAALVALLGFGATRRKKRKD